MFNSNHMCSIYSWKHKHFLMLNLQYHWQSDEWWADRPWNKCYNNPEKKTSHLYRPQISTRLRTFMSLIRTKRKIYLIFKASMRTYLSAVKKKTMRCINIWHEFHHSQILSVFSMCSVLYIRFWQLYLSLWHAHVKHVGH